MALPDDPLSAKISDFLDDISGLLFVLALIAFVIISTWH